MALHTRKHTKMAAPWRITSSFLRNMAIMRPTGTCIALDNTWMCAVTQIRCFPARRSTREKREKIKRAYKLKMASEMKKDDVAKRPQKSSRSRVASRVRTSMNHPTREITDDCWIAIHHKRKLFPIPEVIEMHRDTHHPTIYNQPNAPVYVSLELNMSLEKKNKFLDAFNGVIKLPHYFDDGIKKTIMAFCKTENDQNKALDAGADIAGGPSLIKKILAGEILVPDYRYVVSHTDIMNEIGALRGILKRKFPSITRGSLGMDMAFMVDKFKYGLEYTSVKDTTQHDFAWIDVPVGTLKMTNNQLEDNIGILVKTVCTHKSPKLGQFITVAIVTSPPSKEKIAIDISKYTPQTVEDDDDDDVEEAKSLNR